MKITNYGWSTRIKRSTSGLQQFWIRRAKTAKTASIVAGVLAAAGAVAAGWNEAPTAWQIIFGAIAVVCTF
jgi:hypothetical protein